MASEELVAYVRSELANGTPTELIKTNLRGENWPDSLIDEAMAAAKAEPASAAVIAQSASTADAPVLEAHRLHVPAPLPPTFSMFGEAWKMFISRFWTLAGIAILPFVVPGIIAFCFGAYSGYVGMETPEMANSAVEFFGWPLVIVGSLVALAILIVSFVLMILSQPAALIALHGRHEKIGVKQAYLAARKKGASFFWVAMLTGLTILASTLLFAVPGLIMIVLLIAAPLVVVFEEEKGAAAMSKSREYVRGHFWKVFLYGLLVFVASFAVGAVTALPAIFGYKTLSDILSFITRYLLQGLWFACLYVLYVHLKASKPDLATVVLTRGKRALIVGFAIFGCFAIVTLLSAVVLISLQTAREKQAEAEAALKLLPPASLTISAEGTLYQSASQGISMTFPPMWNVEASSSNPVLLAEKNPFSMFMGSYPVPKEVVSAASGDIKKIISAAQFKEGIKNEKNPTSEPEVSAVIIGTGTPAYQGIYSSVSAYGKEIMIAEYFFLGKDAIFNPVFVAPKETYYLEGEPQFVKILGSLELR